MKQKKSQNGKCSCLVNSNILEKSMWFVYIQKILDCRVQFLRSLSVKTHRLFFMQKIII